MSNRRNRNHRSKRMGSSLANLFKKNIRRIVNKFSDSDNDNDSDLRGSLNSLSINNRKRGRHSSGNIDTKR